MRSVRKDLERALRVPFADRGGLAGLAVGGASLALAIAVSLVAALALDPVWVLGGTMAGLVLQLPLAGLLLRAAGAGYEDRGPPSVGNPIGLLGDGLRFLLLGVAVVLPAVLVVAPVGMLGWFAVPETVLLLAILAGMAVGGLFLVVGTYVFPAAVALVAIGGFGAAVDRDRMWPILRSREYVVAVAVAWVLLTIATNVVPLLWLVLVGFPLTVALEVSALWLVGARIRAIEANG